MARWRRDGRGLFYIGLDGRLMAVPVHVISEGQMMEAFSPLPLFNARIGPPVQPNSRQQYMVAPDGQRFLLNALAEENAPPITLVLNWSAALKK